MLGVGARRGDRRRPARRRPPRVLDRASPCCSSRPSSTCRCAWSAQQFHASADGMAAAERIFEVLDTPPAVERAGASPLPAPDPRTRAGRARATSRFAYPGRGAPVLDGVVAASSRPGELVALVGPSGEGKSTIAALLLRLLDPDAGALACGGVDLRDVDPRAWRRQLAWVPQRPTIFAGTRRRQRAARRRRRAADAQVAAARRRPPALARGRRRPAGRAARRASATAGGASRPARRSASRSRARSCATRRWWCSTSRPRTSTARPPRSSAPRSSGSRAGRTTLLIAHRPALAGAPTASLRLAAAGRPGRRRRSATGAAHDRGAGARARPRRRPRGALRRAAGADRARAAAASRCRSRSAPAPCSPPSALLAVAGVLISRAALRPRRSSRSRR